MAEVDGQGYAVAVEAGEERDLRKARMLPEDRFGACGEQDRAAPAVRDADIM